MKSNQGTSSGQEQEKVSKINFYWSISVLNIVLVSTVQKSEVAIHMHICPLFWISFPFRSQQSTHQVAFPELYSRSSLVIYFIYSNNSVYTSIAVSQIIPEQTFDLKKFQRVKDGINTSFFFFQIYFEKTVFPLFSLF